MITAPARLAALLLALVLAVAPLAAQTPEEPSAEALARAQVATLVNEVDAARREGGDSAEARARIRAAVAEAFDLALWRRAVLGDRTASFSEDQLAALDAALPGYFASLYLRYFAGITGRAPEVGGVRPGRGDLFVEVAMRHQELGDLDLLYRVRMREGRPRVLDVIVGGISFAIMHRDEFAALIDRQGPAALVAYLDDNAI